MVKALTLLATYLHTTIARVVVLPLTSLVYLLLTPVVLVLLTPAGTLTYTNNAGGSFDVDLSSISGDVYALIVDGAPATLDITRLLLLLMTMPM